MSTLVLRATAFHSPYKQPERSVQLGPALQSLSLFSSASFFTLSFKLLAVLLFCQILLLLYLRCLSRPGAKLKYHCILYHQLINKKRLIHAYGFGPPMGGFYKNSGTGIKVGQKRSSPVSHLCRAQNSHCYCLLYTSRCV